MFPFNYYFLINSKDFFKAKFCCQTSEMFLFWREEFAGPVYNIYNRSRHRFFLSKDEVCETCFLSTSQRLWENKWNYITKVLLAAGGIANVRQCVILLVRVVNSQQLCKISNEFLLHGGSLEAKRAIWLLTSSENLCWNLKEKRVSRSSNN